MAVLFAAFSFRIILQRDDIQSLPFGLRAIPTVRIETVELRRKIPMVVGLIRFAEVVIPTVFV